MARFVEFHQKVIVHPGAEAYVDVSGMVQPNANVTDIAGVIAEAPNGQPGVLHVFADDTAARDFFGAGSDAANAVFFLTKKSPDDRVAEGAGLVYVYKPNVTKQAEHWLTVDPYRDIAGTSTPVGAGGLEFTVEAAAKKTSTDNAYVEFLLPGSQIDDQFQNCIIEVSNGPGAGQQRQIKTCRVSGLNWRISLRDDQDWDTIPFITNVTSKVKIKIPIIRLQSTEWGPRGLQNEFRFVEASTGVPDLGYKFDTRYDGRIELLSQAVGGIEVNPKVFVRFDPSNGNLTDVSGWFRSASSEFTTTVAATATLLDGATALVTNDYTDRYVLITGTNTSALASLIGQMFKVASNAATNVTLVGSGLGLTPGLGLKYRLVELTTAYIQVTGKDGEATSIDVAVNDTQDATFNGGNPQTIATFDLTQLKTLQELVNKINQTPFLDGFLGDGVSGTLATTRFDFSQRADHWQASIIQGPSATLKGGVIRDNVQSMIDWISQNHGRYFATRAIGPGNNDSSQGYDIEIGGAEPDVISSYKRLYDGDVGISRVLKADSTDTNPIQSQRISWEHGLEQLIKIDEIKTEVLACSEDLNGWASGDIDSLINLFKSHLLDAEDARQWRNGYMGLKLPLEPGTFNGVTYTRGLLDWIRLLDEERMSITGQEIKAFDTTGSENWQPAWAFACQCASIQLGTDLGEGLTLKKIGATDMRQPIYDWDPLDKLQGRKAVLGALLYAKTLRRSFRIARGSTSKVSSNNLALSDINVWEIRNHVIRELSIKLEDRFGGAGIGNPGGGVRFVAPASSASIREAVATELDEMRAEGIIVDSEDETGNRLKAYQGLAVRISGDIATVKVQVFPKTALNFILVDFQFQLPVQSAA